MRQSAGDIGRGHGSVVSEHLQRKQSVMQRRAGRPPRQQWRRGGIEHGEIRGGIRNFRFNQNVVELLRNVEALSPACRTAGEEAPDMVVPAIKAHEFNFTEVTKF